MARGQSRSSRDKRRAGRRRRTLPLDVIAGRYRFDHDDTTGTIRFRAIDRHDSIHPLRQVIAGRNRDRQELKRIVGTGAERRICPHGKTVQSSAV